MMKASKKNRAGPSGNKRARMGAKTEALVQPTGVTEEQLNRKIDKLQAQLDSMDRFRSITRHFRGHQTHRTDLEDWGD